MNAKDLFKHQFTVGREVISRMIADLTDEDMLVAPARGGNFPLWIIGHLAYSEAFVLHVRIKGGANPLPQWERTLGRGSQPVPGGAGYPPRQELWAAFLQRRNELVAFVEAQSDADFDRPTGAENPFFGTVGKVLGMLATHQFFHAGQIADVRRQLGRPPVFG